MSDPTQKRFSDEAKKMNDDLFNMVSATAKLYNDRILSEYESLTDEQKQEIRKQELEQAKELGLC